MASCFRAAQVVRIRRDTYDLTGAALLAVTWSAACDITGLAGLVFCGLSSPLKSTAALW
jgi:hypothetical protein